MARSCTVCRHEQRNEIDRALIGGEQQTGISSRFGIAQSSLSRHLHNHLAPKFANAIGRYEPPDVERLRSWALGLYEEALLGMLRAKAEKNSAEARAWMAEARRNLELRSKLCGAIGDGSASVTIDARKQTLVLDALDEAALRKLAEAAEQGRLGEAAKQAGLPPAAVAGLDVMPAVVEGATVQREAIALPAGERDEAVLE